MTTKLVKLKAAIFATTLAANASVQAYDVFEYSGAAPTELHNFQSTFPGVGEPGCGIVCSIVGGSLDYNVMMRLQNITPGFTAGASNAMVDRYTGELWSTTAGALPVFLHYDTYLPVPDQDYLTTYNPTIPDNAQAWTPHTWDFTTSAEGKIIDGYMIIYQYENYFTAYDFTNRRLIEVSFCAVDASGNEAAPSITSLRGIDPNDLSGTFPATGCSAFEVLAPLAYLTCDTWAECGQFGKSVPVPALATGALGLGILGISLLTRRRFNSLE